MNDFITLLKNWKTILLFFIIVGVVIASAAFFSLRGVFDIDRENYVAVAEHFIRKSGFIAHNLGKVTSLSHIGKGGASGRQSYNVFRVLGKDEVGVCNITLTRDDVDDWFVTYADLSVRGRVLSVPIKRSEGEKWQRFKLR